MSKKLKIMIVSGGTGGHVLPGYNLAAHLSDNDYEVELITDKRGNQYLKKLKKFNVSILPSAPFLVKNIFTILYS